MSYTRNANTADIVSPVGNEDTTRGSRYGYGYGNGYGDGDGNGYGDGYGNGGIL